MGANLPQIGMNIPKIFELPPPIDKGVMFEGSQDSNLENI